MADFSYGRSRSGQTGRTNRSGQFGRSGGTGQGNRAGGTGQNSRAGGGSQGNRAGHGGGAPAAPTYVSPQTDGADGRPEADGIRLQKVLAAAGIASRRGSEALIEEGRVEVNGHIVMALGTRVDPARDHIRVDGRRLPPERRHVYLVLNKPRGVVSTLSDPEGRPSLADYTPPRLGRLFHVGRLDVDTEGLIVLTNDGELAQRLTHPRYEVAKTYLAQLDGVIDRPALDRLARGVTLEDGLVRPDKVRLVDSAGGRSLVEIRLHSGRNRVVRRLFEAVGYSVRRLARTRIGPIRLGDLPVGQTRPLSRDELGTLFDAAGL